MLEAENKAYPLDYINEATIYFDCDGVISYANQSARTLFDYGQKILGCNMELLFPGVFDFTQNPMGSQLKIGADMIMVNAYRKNRTCFPMMAKVVYGPCEGTYLFIGYDAIEKEFTEHQLEQTKLESEEALKVKSEFTANVTHELRTPVNGILGNTRELVEVEEDPKKRQLLALIERGCADMNAIINNILDFSKLEAGKFTIEKREFVFRDMMDYVKSNHKNKIAEKGLDFIVTISPDIPERLIGDELRIVQVLNNLISNACKFTSVGRIVVEVVRTAQVDNRMELFFLVIDTGIGIDKAGMDKLFKSFSQVDASISRKYGGTGLGLNISKQLVELMEGDIHVESEYGKGSMFSFHIWVDVPEEMLAKQTTSSTIPAMTVEPPKIQNIFEDQGQDEIKQFGTERNLEEIRRRTSKLILSVDMDNWRKAEDFAESIKQLTEGAPHEIKMAGLRLKMAVQKGDYDKTAFAVENFKSILHLE